MKQPKNLFLIGPMGAGKSAVGRQLARMLHLDFVDSDEEIENRPGSIFPSFLKKKAKKDSANAK
jgi:shikimate kinase